jgi:hypothetical protein
MSIDIILNLLRVSFTNAVLVDPTGRSSEEHLYEIRTVHISKDVSIVISAQSNALVAHILTTQTEGQILLPQTQHIIILSTFRNLLREI